MNKKLDFTLNKDTTLVRNLKSKELKEIPLGGNWNGIGLESTRLYWGAFNHNVYTEIVMPKTHITIFTLLNSSGEVIFNDKSVTIGDMLMLGEGAKCKITSSCSTKWVFFLIKRKDLKKLGHIKIVKPLQDIGMTELLQKPLLYQINNLLKMLTVVKGTMGDNQYIEFLYRNISALIIYPIIKFNAIDSSAKDNQKQLISDMQKYLDKYILPT